MVIAAKPKAHPTIHHKKRTGQHQRQTKHYMKTYWPYLPLVLAAIGINSLAAQQTSATVANINTASVSRIELWTNAGPWITALIITVAILSMTIVVTRHAVAWQRVASKSEAFFIHHHTLDLILVGITLVGIIVTRSV